MKPAIPWFFEEESENEQIKHVVDLEASLGA